MFDNNHVTLVAVTHYYCYMTNVISVEQAIRPSMQMKWLAWMSWWLVNCKLHKKLTKHARAHIVTRSLPHPLAFSHFTRGVSSSAVFRSFQWAVKQANKLWRFETKLLFPALPTGVMPSQVHTMTRHTGLRGTHVAAWLFSAARPKSRPGPTRLGASHHHMQV